MSSSTHPFLDNGFHIRWSTLTPDTIEADISLALKEAQKNVEALAGEDWKAEELTFANTLLALEQATEELSEKLGQGWPPRFSLQQ